MPLFVTYSQNNFSCFVRCVTSFLPQCKHMLLFSYSNKPRCFRCVLFLLWARSLTRSLSGYECFCLLLFRSCCLNRDAVVLALTFNCSFPGMLPVHPSSAAARHRPPPGRSGEGKGGSGRAGGPAFTPAAPIASSQQFATAPDRGQRRAVRGGGRGEERQRRCVYRGQLLLPYHCCIYCRQGNSTDGRRVFYHFKLPSPHALFVLHTNLC